MSDERRGLDADFFIENKGRDPLRAARESGRAPLPKRFYRTAEAAPVEGGFAVRLDGKQVKTPSRQSLIVVSQALAEALAAEWAGQGEFIDPASMPLTRLVNSAIDGVAAQMREVEAELVKYASSDLICYRAGQPESLAKAQAAAWDPLVAYVRAKLGARLVLAEGIVFAPQPDEALAAIAQAVQRHVGNDAGSPFRLAALHAMATLTGSCIIGLATALREIEATKAWVAAHVDEDFQMKAWGDDFEALARRANRWNEMRSAAFLSECVTPASG